MKPLLRVRDDEPQPIMKVGGIKRSDLAETNPSDGVVVPLLQDEIRAESCRLDILFEIYEVDLFPDAVTESTCLFFGEIGISCEEGVRILEGRTLELQKTFDVPLSYVRHIRIYVNTEIEEVRHKDLSLRLSGDGLDLQDIDAFYNKDIGIIDDLHLIGDNIVVEMRVDGGLKIGTATLDSRKEAKETDGIVTLREALTVEDTTSFELGIGIEITVGSDEVDMRCRGIHRKELAKNPRCRALSYRHTTGNADDIGDLDTPTVKKRIVLCMKPLSMRDVYLQKPAQGEVDILYLLKRERLIEPLQLRKVDLLQWEVRMVVKPAPLLTSKALKRRKCRSIERWKLLCLVCM